MMLPGAQVGAQQVSPLQAGPNGVVGAPQTTGPNGVGPPLAAPSLHTRPVPIPTPKQIVDLTDAHERYREPLSLRMEADWDLLTLKEFDAGEGYRSYTSNEPMTFYEKMTTALSSGKMKASIPVQRAKVEKREREAQKERFVVGMLKANDERLLRLGQPRLLNTLAGHINARGWYAGRSMLVKDPETGETYVDITPWDPLHVSWGMGPKGLRWICHKTKKNRAGVASEFGINLDAVLGQASSRDQAEQYFGLQMTDESEGVDVYDWYDEIHNTVVINGTYAKLPTRHTPIRRVPAFFGVVGSLPLIQGRNGTGNQNLKYQGESIFAANRRIYEKLNLVYSTMLQLVALSRDQAFWIGSADGTKRLKDNPSLEGAQFGLAFGETFNIVPLLEMSKDTSGFLGLVAGEIQRGALPYSVYGQLAFQLSGYAVNLLKQATDSPMLPRQQAMENALWQIANSICDQFATGVYGSMQLRGLAHNRDWFDEAFTAEMMLGLPAVEIKLKAMTPQDELQKMQLAQAARQGPWPLLSDRIIYDEVMELDDPDSIANAVKEQVGERLLPQSQVYELMVAAEKAGDRIQAMIYYGELVRITMTMGSPTPPPPWAQAGQGGPGGGRGFSPQVSGGPPRGAPGGAPTPEPQQGPNVPAGSPRPGARQPAAVPPVVAAWG